MASGYVGADDIDLPVGGAELFGDSESNSACLTIQYLDIVDMAGCLLPPVISATRAMVTAILGREGICMMESRNKYRKCNLYVHCG